MHAASNTDQEMADNDQNDSYTTVAVVDGIAIFHSIVHKTTTSQNLQTQEVDLFVLIMNICIKQNIM